MKRYEVEKKAFEQHCEKADKQFDDFRAAAQEQFDQRTKEKPVRRTAPVSQSPWFEALRTGKM
ncbi:MAG: hypothetical protein ACOVQN_05695 [Exiguobacterium sp.]